MTAITVNHTAVAQPSSKGTLWVSRILSGLPVLGLLASAAFKLSHAPQVVEKFTGTYLFREGQLNLLAGLEIICTVLYVIPRTAVLGVVLLTAYLGGAIATHVRSGDSSALPLVLALLAWGGLYLRDARIRALSPFASASVRQ